ncbi:hypothetical protein ACFQU7_35740 [Pseudoroseomonas wenyumeiae]
MSTSIGERLDLLGLKVVAADLPKVEALVLDLEKAAAVVRIARPYGEEPLSVFRIPQSQSHSRVYQRQSG